MDQTKGYDKYSVNLSSSSTVRDWISSRASGASLLPEAIDIYIDTERVQSNMGQQAQEGFVAMNLAYGDFLSAHINASFVVVIDLFGNLQNVLIPPSYVNDNATSLYRMEGLKFFNATSLLMASNSHTRDRYFVWDWVSDGIEVLGNGIEGSSHDIQHLPQSNSFISINTDFTYLMEWNSEGDITWNWTAPEWLTTASVTGTHMNHVQQTEDDVVFVSARDLSSIFKVNKATSSVEWVLGGKMGDFDIVDEAGIRYKRNTVYFHRQHNAEYIGDDTFIMFDNGVNITSSPVYPSRLLMLQVNQSTQTANVVWEWSTNAHSRIFGDADRLPSGGVLACYWPDVVIPNSKWDRERYEAIAIEVDDSRDVAWWMGVRSHSESWIGTDGSSHYARHNGEAPTGWAMYSVERMYPSPLITDLSYDAVTQTISMHIYNTHKENFHTQATLEVTCGAASMSVTTDFEPFWRPARVEKSIAAVVVEDRDMEDCVLVLTNTWSQSATVSFSLH